MAGLSKTTRYLTALVVLSGAGVQVASAETVYVYDNADKMSKMVNEVPVWKDAASAQSSNRYFFKKGSGPVKCMVRPPATHAARKQTIGKAVEVRVYGSCTGFVNSRYVHTEE
jgi:hypothetical protein